MDWLQVGNCSVTRLADFWKFSMTNIHAKVVQMLGKFWCFFETQLLSKACCCHFLANFWKKLGYFLFQNLVSLFGRLSRYLLVLEEINFQIKFARFWKDCYTVRPSLTKVQLRMFSKSLMLRKLKVGTNVSKLVKIIDY